jgi:hypothetical protein
MRGAIVVDVGAKDLEATRAALARAVASGALGAGYAVKRDGDGVVFESAGARGIDRGRVALTSDGRATWEASLGRSERLRVVEAVLLAAAVSVAATIGWSLMVHQALPLGGAVGVGYAIARIVGDRVRARRQLRNLVASLALLLGA